MPGYALASYVAVTSQIRSADPDHECPDPGAQRVVKSQVDVPAVAAGQAGASRAANLAHER